MDFAITRLSSKGQIVIPAYLRKDIEKGDEFLLVRDGNKIILKNMKRIAEDLKEDVKFAQKIDEAWHEHSKGKFGRKNRKDFLAELRRC
ncbi:MAG: AbrB/MazE/SpoVT family DNA-binding domain-containing protein [Nanoarchaeota archaeon]